MVANGATPAFGLPTRGPGRARRGGRVVPVMTIDMRRAALCPLIAMLGACSLGDGGPTRGAADAPLSPVAAQPLTPGAAAAGIVIDPLVDVGPAASSALAESPVPVAAPAPLAGVPTALLRRRAAELDNELAGLVGVIEAQRAELQGLAQGAAESAELYVAAVAAMNGRPSAGAPPDDPILASQWRAARGALKDVAAAYSARLRELNSRIAVNRGMTAYLAESTRAARAVRAALGVDQGEIAGVESRVARVIDENERLLAEIERAFDRYAAWLDDAPAPPPGLAPLPEVAGLSPPPVAEGAPALVTVRFARPDVAYEDALYEAVAAALQRRPEANFELVAVAPLAADSAEAQRTAEAAGRNAERVMETLLAMNLPPERIRLSFATSAEIAVSEVRLFAR